MKKKRLKKEKDEKNGKREKRKTQKNKEEGLLREPETVYGPPVPFT